MLKLLSPFAVTILLLTIGMLLLVTGVYLLAGLGFALLVLSVPFLGASAVLIRGLARVGY